MKKKFSTLIILIFSFVIVFAGCEKSDYEVHDTLKKVKGETARVVLLFGQSNATGNTYNSYLQEKDETTFNLASQGFENSYINFNCEYGCNFSNNRFLKCKLGQGVSTEGFGPEIGISKAYKEKSPSSKLFIVKFTVGGTALYDQWLDSNGNRGEIYNDALEFTKCSLNYLKKKGYKLKIDGLCWMQGESDACTYDVSLKYYQNTKNFISYWREDLKNYTTNLKFIDAGISIFWLNKDIVNNAKQQFANESENNYYFSTIDLGIVAQTEPVGNIDYAHFDSLSMIKLGETFADYLFL